MRFCVDNDSRPENVASALLNLRRMVKLGKRAERILAALRREGHFDGKIPLLSKAPGNGWYNVSVHSFPAYQPISRDDVPGWADLTVECGERKRGSHGGTKFWEMPVFLKGEALVMELDDGEQYTGNILRQQFNAKTHKARLGACRMKSNGAVTFEPALRYGGGVVFRIRRNTEASDKARAEAESFAKLMAKCVVNTPVTGYQSYHINAVKVPQKILDLQAAVPGWLLEDGHVQRAFVDMLDAIECVKVMNS